MVARRTQKYDNKSLRKRLTFTLLGIFSFIFVAIIAVSFFGPQIGALFGFISVNKNNVIPQAQVAVSPPAFLSLPKAINEKNLTIEGYSNPGTTVKLFLNGPEKGEALAGGDGKFVFENIALIDGRNTIFAKAIDENEMVSERSETHVIAVDTKAPKIKLVSPLNGETIKNLDKRILVEGEINEEAKITINDKLAVQKTDLSFEFLLGVSEGDVEIKIKAVDEAGNEKEEKIFVKYEKD